MTRWKVRESRGAPRSIRLRSALGRGRLRRSEVDKMNARVVVRLACTGLRLAPASSSSACSSSGTTGARTTWTPRWTTAPILRRRRPPTPGLRQRAATRARLDRRRRQRQRRATRATGGGPGDVGTDGPVLGCTPGRDQCTGNGVQTAARAAVGLADGLRQQACVSGACAGQCAPGSDAVLAAGQRRADVHRERAVGRRRRRAATRPAWLACASASCAARRRRSARATACRRATRPAPGARAMPCASGDVRRRPVHGRVHARARRSARATACRRAARTGRGADPVAVHDQACSAGACTGACAPGTHAVLGQRRADVRRDRHVGHARAPARTRASAGACTGVCTPGATRCSGNGVQTCDATGQWGPRAPCTNQPA